MTSSSSEKKNFAGNLRRLRLATGMSQEELAARAGLHRTYISSIERGQRNVSLENIHALARDWMRSPRTPKPLIRLRGSVMGFKVNTSFLRFLTMGALGVRATIEHLGQHGFEPIELERYCTSNKIWATKVKRLRLPDLLCVRTGVRIEVRAKSELKIRMSDAPDNPDRRWDAGLRGEDLIAFVVCRSDGNDIVPIGAPIFLKTEDVRASEPESRLGPPKSASEGSERDREWPCIVPRQDGQVVEVVDGKIKTQLESGRRQTYGLRGKQPYVAACDNFSGGVSILAGVVPSLVDVQDVRDCGWDPLAMLHAPSPVDRYAAAKGLPHRSGPAAKARTVLEDALDGETEERVALEQAASAARLGSQRGLGYISDVISRGERDDLRMEGALILAELGDDRASDLLYAVATDPQFRATEIRQAAVWGLGRAGTRSYGQLVEFLDDHEDEVALHATAAFGQDTPPDVIEHLVDSLLTDEARRQPAASEALRLIGAEHVVAPLIAAARTSDRDLTWVLATLGRLDADRVRAELSGDPLLDRIKPVMALFESANWLSRSPTAEDFAFLRMQDVP